MYRLGRCDLVYIHQFKDDDYNPKIDKFFKPVKCHLMNSFSSNYYRNQTRDMRKSKNIRIPKYLVNDIFKCEKRYSLEYVYIGHLKYKIVNILMDKDSSLYSILDCEEIINE